MFTEIENVHIGVLIATYNGEKYIREQIDSILSQVTPNTIIIVHDDGSRDSTNDILQQYQNSNPERFIVLNSESTGSSKSNFIYILKKALDYDLDYFFFADQDDIWLPGKFNTLMQKMGTIESKDTPCVIFSDMIVVDENLCEISPSFFKYIGADPNRTLPNQLIMQSFIAGCSMLINRKAAELAMYYKDIDNIYMHDWWVSLIASYIGRIELINEPFVLYRQHASNQIGAKQKKKSEIIGHLFSTLFGNHSAEIKARVNRSRMFAMELKDVPGISNEQYIFLSEFARLSDRNKLSRIIFYYRNELKRNNKRNWLFYLYV